MKKYILGIVASLCLGILSIVALPKIVTFAMVNNVKTDELALSAKNCYLVDYNSGTVMYAKGEDEKRQIASMVKIMTTLLTFEAIERGELSLDKNIIVSHEAAKQTGSEMFLDENQSYTVTDLIKGMVVVSANDASVAIAEQLSGSEQAFCGKMMERASQLGMKNTKFSNATGLPTLEEQYSTAKDVSIMTRALLEHQGYYNYSKIWLEDYKHPSGRVTQFANTNKLIRFYKGCDSGKTGYTDNAKFCLSASATRNGFRIVGTILGADNSKDRFGDMTKMFNYAFANYKSNVYLQKGSSVEAELEVSKGNLDTIKPIVSKDLAWLLNKNSKDLEVKYEYHTLKAPLKASDTVGFAVLYESGKEVARVELIAGVDVKKATFWDYVKKLTEKM